MQPVHCVLQHHVANLHVSTHMATKRDTNHAAIPLCNHSFHQLPKHPVTTHRRTTTCCRTESRNRFDDETIATATATHRRYLSSPAAATLHGKTRGFVLRLPPQHKPHATCMQPAQVITMRFTTKDSKTPYVCNCNAQEHAKHIEAAVTLRTTPRLG